MPPNVIVCLPRILRQVVLEDVGGQVLVFVLSASQLLPGKLPAQMVGQPVTPNGLGRPEFLRPVREIGECSLTVGIAVDADQQFIEKGRREDVRLRDGACVHAVSPRPVPKPLVSPSAGEPKRPPDSSPVVRPRVNLPERLSAAENR